MFDDTQPGDLEEAQSDQPGSGDQDDGDTETS